MLLFKKYKTEEKKDILPFEIFLSSTSKPNSFSENGGSGFSEYGFSYSSKKSRIVDFNCLTQCSELKAYPQPLI